MNRIAKKLFCVALAAVMGITTLVTASPVSAAKDPQTIDRVVVDMRSAEAFAKNTHVYEHTPTQNEPDPYTGGKFSFSDTMKAMRVEYNENAKAGNTYRVMTMFNVAGSVTAEYKYWVIVYAAKTTEPYKLTLWNSPRFGNEVVVNASGKDTGGKFVVSDPFDISATTNEKGISILSRWTGVTQNTITFASSDKNAEFYIKEYAFFKSAEDARAYYAAVDLNKSPSEYGENAIKVNAPAAPQTPATPTAPADVATLKTKSGAGLVDLTYKVIEEPVVEKDTVTSTRIVDPVILSFEGKENFEKNGKFNEFEAGDHGSYEFVTLDDGTQCLKLNDHAFKSFANYRMMATFNNPNVVGINHKFMRITYMTNDTVPAPITIYNNKTAAKTTIVADASVSGGRFVRSNAVDIYTGEYLGRYLNSIHNTIGYESKFDSSEFYIKEIGFFCSEEQAYEYYGDSYSAELASIEYSEIPFGTRGTGIAARDDATWGTSSDSDLTLDITYCEKTNVGGVKYMAKVKPSQKGLTDPTMRFIRVLYSASHPEGITSASMILHCDLGGDRILLSDDVKNTNGEFVLTEPVYMTELMATRFTNCIHNSLIVNTTGEGGKYSIKAIYMFSTREDAENFTAKSDEHTVTINGNDISKYQIVVSKDAPINVANGAKKIATQILKSTGIEIPVVTDEAPVTPYEILVGISERPLSYARRAELEAKDFMYYWIDVDGDTLVISGCNGLSAVTAIETALVGVFYSENVNAPEKIEIKSGMSISGVDSQYKLGTFWKSGDPIEDPTVFTEDFDTDDGYFNEDNGEKNWSYKDGSYMTDAKSYASSYLHVYEKNVNYKAKLTFTSENDGCMGILARVNSEKSFIKAGYDFKSGAWYIESRDSGDYFLERVAEVPASVTAGTAYRLELSVMNETATLTVNGNTVIEGAKVTHFSPGRLGVYAENASVSVDDIEITLVSGQGTIIPNVYHTKFGSELYLEGGSVFEMNDGSWKYSHHSGRTYNSTDNGYTWVEGEKWTDTYGYINIIRLNNGDWLKIINKNNKKISQTSSDDGKTWVDGGIITDQKFKGDTTAGAGNMNDKLTVTASGRILYSQNYESATVLVDGRHVFCEYFFSDDNGKTWCKSETASWELEGNEDQKYFGENKLLECADGTIRMYASWHPYDHIAYADSTDGGKTFGPMQFLDYMYTPHSSMQFVRDPYADNDYTYYMVWVNAEIAYETKNNHTPRSRLSLAKTTDGKNWEYIGDIWRWESTYLLGSTIINHIVDPFIKVTEDYIICGSGFSDGRKVDGEAGASAHQGQRQHIFTIKKDTLPESKAMNVFTDVTYGAPYYEAVSYVVNEGLFNGTGERTFSPAASMTRSMFVTVLGRLAKADVAAYATPTFNDVAAGQWYTSYVEWAAANGIVNGLGNGIYGINDNVTVQQACVILARYADYKAATTQIGKTAADFADGANVASWAAKEVDWAIANGIYNGAGASLNPTSPASRALVATMFANYVKAFG